MPSVTSSIFPSQKYNDLVENPQRELLKTVVRVLKCSSPQKMATGGGRSGNG